HVKHIYDRLVEHLREEIPEVSQKRRYPQHWGLEGHVHRVVRELLVSELLTYEFASYFEGKSFEELDELAASFKLENCLKRDGLNKILQEDAGLSG
ncbi:endo-1,4-beta-glucanase, partial [Oleoguttula sp. CCFEE 5521]